MFDLAIFDQKSASALKDLEVVEFEKEMMKMIQGTTRSEGYPSDPKPGTGCMCSCGGFCGGAC